MAKKSIKILVLLVLMTFLGSSNIVLSESSNEIIFNDKNLQSALGKFYDWNKAFSKEKASELSRKKNLLILDSKNITDLEGLQYFNNLSVVDLSGNALNDLSILPKLKKLSQIIICFNSIKGEKFENIINEMGNIGNLKAVNICGDEIVDIGFLKKIGNIKNYSLINMSDNKISDISILKNAVNCDYLDLSNNKINDISILKKAVNLKTLDLSDNRITDITPLKNLKKLYYNLDLKDNCIIDYKPIKPILDKIYEEGGWDGVISRYDYYTNPVDVGVNGRTVKFPYLTAYYKYQAYVEAIPLFKALGGSAKYEKETGALTCEYDGNVLEIKDFSKSYTLNGKQIGMKYPMRRMQYDLAYVPVKDICKAFKLCYKVTKKRKLSEAEDEYFYAPQYIKISADRN